MRIKNKYIRNKHYRFKHLKRIRSETNPYETSMPSGICGIPWYTYEEQVKSNLEDIVKKARVLESGCRSGKIHATSDFRRTYSKRLKSQERNALRKVCKGEYDIPFPIFKKSVDWDYF